MLTCDVGDLVAGGATLFTITVDVAPDVVYSAGGPTTITNTVSVDGVGNEANPADNSDSEDTMVVAEADLEIVSFDAVTRPRSC